MNRGSGIGVAILATGVLVALTVAGLVVGELLVSWLYGLGRLTAHTENTVVLGCTVGGFAAGLGAFALLVAWHADRARRRRNVEREAPLQP